MIFLAILLVGVMLITSVFFIHGGSRVYSREEMEELIGQSAETVFSIGLYDDIRIADAEKGVFLVRPVSTGENSEPGFRLVNEKGEVLYKILGTRVIDQAGKNFALKYGDGVLFFNTDMVLETGEPPKPYDSVELSECCNYVLLRRDGKAHVQDMDGNVLYSSHAHTWLSGKEDYVIEEDIDGLHHIVNMTTGETEYTAPQGVAIMGYSGGMWLLDSHNEFDDIDIIWSYGYLLDDEYNITADSGIISGWDLGGESSADYMSVQQELTVNYENRQEIGRSGGKRIRVYSHGNLVYDAVPETKYEGTNGSHIRYIKGDILAASGYNETLIDYIDLTTGETVIADSEIFSFMDLEDGIAAACICNKNQNTDSRSGSFLTNENKMKDYSWGFVDKDLNPLTEFVFDGAYPTENGYAVVVKDGQKGLIRLKGVN